MKEKDKKKIWKISANMNTGLTPVFIVSKSMDDALEIARKIDSRYNTAQLHSYQYSYCY